MKILKKYMITLSFLIIALVILGASDHYLRYDLSTKQDHISRLKRPAYSSKKQILTGNKTILMGDLESFNSHERHQINFAKQFLVNHFTYDNANMYANNRNRSHKQMTAQLWNKVQNNEFSPQTNRIGKSLISKNRSTSNFISATPAILSTTLPQKHINDENVPIYYLVTNSYTNNINDSSNTGKTYTLIKIQVDTNKSLVSNYQVINRISHT